MEQLACDTEERYKDMETFSAAMNLLQIGIYVVWKKNDECNLQIFLFFSSAVLPLFKKPLMCMLLIQQKVRECK